MLRWLQGIPREYIDDLLGLGPMILGHRPARVTQAVTDIIQQRGTVFGAANGR